jgi:hypothetical protein
MNKYLPTISVFGTASEMIYKPIFDELNAVLVCLDSVCKESSPLQRQLSLRFISACKILSCELVAAACNGYERRVGFSVSSTGQMISQVDGPAAKPSFGELMCSEVCDELEYICQRFQHGLTEGVVDVIAAIRAEHKEGPAHSKILDALHSSVIHLVCQVGADFEMQIQEVRALQHVVHLEIEEAKVGCEATYKVSADDFMKTTKPFQRRLTLRERIEPYLAQLTKLRDFGYTYKQCTEYLRENGLEIRSASVRDALREVHGK